MSSSSTDPDVTNSPTDTPRKIRCLVIQLTRLGDTLQSMMALRAAKQLYPQLEIHFVARERFADAAKRIPWIENVITFPSDKILGPVLSGDGSQAQALRDIARWMSPLVERQWDFIVNWSYSESSSYLTGILPGKVKLGFSRAPQAESSTLVAPDGWSHYIQAVIQGGVQQNIHLTDILTTQLLTALQIHAGEPADAGDAPVTSKSFFHLRMDAGAELAMGNRWRDMTHKWVAFQIGAGNDEKTWDAANWAALGKRILKNHPEYGIVLMGGSEDRPREQTLLKALAGEARPDKALAGEARPDQALTAGAEPVPAHSVISLVGKSDFDLWASVVSRCQWVFSCDTAAIHLASVLGTRVVNLSIGPVRLTETGPYGNGHYVLSAQHDCPACLEGSTKSAGEQSSPSTKSVGEHQSGSQERPAASPSAATAHLCRTRLRPEVVYGAWSYAIHDSALRRSLSLDSHLERLGIRNEGAVRIFRSRIRGTSDGGGVVYEPVIDYPMELKEWTSMVMGHIARAWYCGWVPPVGSELSRARITPPLIQKLRELDESSQLLSQICDEANRTAMILNRRSSRLRSDRVMDLGDRNELRELGDRLFELDLLIERLGKAHAPLQAFAQMSKVLMHNLKGEQIAELGKESAGCYRQLADGVGILRDWLKHTLKLARPVAIRPQSPTKTGASVPPPK